MCAEGQIRSANSEIQEEIIQIFSSSQRTSAVHQRNAKILKQLYENCNHPEFWECFKSILTLVLTQDNSPFVEKVLSFLGIFCNTLVMSVESMDESTDEHLDHPLLTEILKFVLEASTYFKDIVRVRACRIINIILDNLVGAEMSLDICQTLEDILKMRLNDLKSEIRQQAVKALYRLQDPTDLQNAIISRFIHLMNSDTSAKVRQLTVEKISVRNDVICHILGRIRDVDPNVRLVAFKRLSGLVKCLKIHEKQQIIHCGFLDKFDKVNEYLPTLLDRWLEHFENNIFKLMQSLRLDADERDLENTVEIFENILKVFFKKLTPQSLTQNLPLNENRLVPFECLNWEVISYWRIYVEYLSKEDTLEDELEKVIPELIHFCGYVKQFYTNMPKEVTTEQFLEQQFIIKQFFLMTKTYDFGDKINRNCLTDLVSNALENVVLISDVIQVIVSNLDLCKPNIIQQSQYVSEIIADILYPVNAQEEEKLENEKNFQISQLNVKINKLKDEQETAKNQEEFILANRIKNELTDLSDELNQLKNSQQEKHVEKKTDTLTTLKCLDIIAALLRSPKVNNLTSTLQALKEDFIQELLIHDDDNIRVKAYECYGLYCIIDKSTAATGIHIFSTPIFAYQKGDECDTQTLLICIAAVVDMLRIYGAQLMAAPKEECLSESMEEKQEAVFVGGTSLTSILQGLVDLMDDDDGCIQQQAGKGLCQLVLSNRIVSASLIARLVLKWCNPAGTEDMECNRLKQLIGYTLEHITLIPDCTEQLIETFFITVKAIYSAPRTSPLADVNVENIAKFLLALCKVSAEADYINNTICSKLLRDIIQNPRNKFNVLYAKMLLLLNVPNNTTQMEELLHFCDTIRDVSSEKSVLNNVTKFAAKLNSKALGIDKTAKGECTKEMQETIFEEEDQVA